MFSVLVLTATNVSSQNTQLEDIQKQAELDARADVKERTWIGTGIGLPIGSVCAGCALAFLTGNYDEGTPGGGYYSEIPTPNLGCMLGAAAAINALGLLSIYRFNSTVNPVRLLGKPPEEVVIYTETYKKSAKKYRLLLSGVPSGGVFTFMSLSCLWAISQ